MRTLRTCSMLAAAAGGVLGFSIAAQGQVSSFTGGSQNDPTNWCDGSNWFPSGVPIDGSVIDIQPGFSVNMFPCSNTMRILGPITAQGSVRFWSPVTFSAGGSLTDPIFDFSIDPVPVLGELTIAGSNSLWRGGIFAAGTIRNTGTLTVQQTSFGGRPFPRELVNSANLINEGTLRLSTSVTLKANSTILNQSSLTCTNSASIARGDQSSAAVLNPGSITVPPGLSLILTAGLTSNGMITSQGTLMLQSEVTLLGTPRVESGGLIRILADPAEAITLGPCIIGGEGTFQLSSGLFRVVEVLCSVRPGATGRGMWFASTDPIDFTSGRMFIGEESVLTWSAGRLNGGNPLADPPHIRVEQGGRLNAVGAPGFGGGGDAYGMAMLIEGEMYQDSLVRLFQGSRVTVPSGGVYSLIHDRLDGDNSGSLMVQGALRVNPRSGPSGSTSFLNAVFTRLDGDATMSVDLADFISGNNSEDASAFELGGNARVTIGPILVFGETARWRAFGRTVVTDGTPRISGKGTFEVASGSSLTIGSALLELAMDVDGSTIGGEFLQLGSVRAAPGSTSARLRNTGTWNWRAGSIVFPQGTEAPVVTTGTMIMDCGSCQLQSDLLNSGSVILLDTLTLNGAGVEFINSGRVELFGNIGEFAPGEGRVVNMPSGLLAKVSRVNQTFSSINTTLDNRGEVQAFEGTLSISGPIVQIQDGVLTGGAWVIRPGATLSTPGRSVHTIGSGAIVDIGGAWSGLQLRNNFGRVVLRGSVTLPGDMITEGDVQIDPAVAFSLSPNARYVQRAGTTTLGQGSTLSSPQPMQVEGGEVGGTGSITSPWLLNPGGQIKPGQSPGVLTVNGGFSQSGNGALKIELAGPTPGTEHDVLVVTGATVLGGTLSVELLNGYVPALGSEFVILTSGGGITNSFAAVQAPPTLPVNIRMAANIGANSVTLRFACAADFNADGNTDADDLADYINCYFATPSCAAAEFNGDSAIDADDLADFINAFFAGC